MQQYFYEAVDGSLLANTDRLKLFRVNEREQQELMIVGDKK